MATKRTESDTASPEPYRDRSILADAAYTLVEFKRRIGVKDAGLRRLRREGLRIVDIPGGRSHVLGKDWIRFLDSRSCPPEPSC